MKNLEGDVAVEESGQDESPVLGVPRYWGIVVQRPKWGRLALTHLEAFFQVIFSQVFWFHLWILLRSLRSLEAHQ